MRILVTGIGGFAGPVVAAAAQAAGHTVDGLVRGDVAPTTLPAVTLHRGDVTDADGLTRLVATVVPDGVIHLAAMSEPARAEADPDAAYRINLGGTLALLGAVRAAAPAARVVVVTSSEVYGAVRRAELPVREDTPLRPTTVYGASKAAADIAAGQWARAYGLHVVRARPFNHTGPGQRPAFVCASIAKQVAAVEAGRQPPELRVGNVDPVRDFGDVRDVAAAYLALLERGQAGEAYNICTGDGVSIAEVIAILRTHARVPMFARPDPTRRRLLDVERIVGSRERITADTGWVPRIPLSDTLRAVLDDWRSRTETSPP
jgi:GDP-4-dehydro-6-deoxy-D-mannose reductase